MSAVRIATCMEQSQQWSIQITRLWCICLPSHAVELPLDTLDRKASWVPTGHTAHHWPCQHCCWWTLATTWLLSSCNLSLILPCISFCLTGWLWLLCMQILICASLLVCLHFWCLIHPRLFVVISSRHCTCVVEFLRLTNTLSILAGCALLCLYCILQLRPTLWRY